MATKEEVAAMWAEAQREVERLRAEGWTRDDFKKALIKLLLDPNAEID